MATNLSSYPWPTLGHILREKRVALGLTQRELASAARVDGSYISQLEHDLRYPSSRTIENLALALGVDVPELLPMYFPPTATRRRAVYVGRVAETRAFGDALAKGGVLAVTGPTGVGKTAFLREKAVPLCRGRRTPTAFFECRRLFSYREFLRGLREAFGAARGVFDAFDGVYEQSGAIERRLRSRFKDPFSLEVAAGGAGPVSQPVELTYAEKYVYRDAERLLTEEFLTGFAGFAGGETTAVFIDDFADVNPTVGYWIRRFLERLNEGGLMTRRFLAVIVAPSAERLGLSSALAARVTAVTLGPFVPAEVDSYLRERGIKPDNDGRARIASLKGDVLSLASWCDYFDAAEDYGARRLALAEDKLRHLEEDLETRVGEGVVRGGEELLTQTRRTLGHLTRLQGRLEEAASYYRGAAELAEKQNAPPASELGFLYLDLGHVARHRGRWDEAIGYYNRATNQFQPQGDYLGAGIAHSSRGTTYRLKGKLGRAKQEYRRAAELLGQLIGTTSDAEARRWMASTLSNDAIAARLEAEGLTAKGDVSGAKRALDRAKALCREAMTVARDLAEEAVAESRYGLALAAEARLNETTGVAAAGLWNEATACYRRALAAFEDLGDRYRVAQLLSDLGVAAAAQGFAHDAIIDFKNSLSLFQQMGSRYHVAKALIELGLLSDGDEQLSYFAEAIASARAHNDDSLVEIVRGVKSALAKGERRRAERFFGDQIDLDPRLRTFLAAP